MKDLGEDDVILCVKIRKTENGFHINHTLKNAKEV